MKLLETLDSLVDVYSVEKFLSLWCGANSLEEIR